MKQHFLLILIILILSSCDKKKTNEIKEETEKKTANTSKSDLIKNSEQNKNQSENKKDTIYNYWELNLDTIVDKRDFKLDRNKLSLELKTFSLNDSLIIRNFGQESEQIYLDHSHTIVSELKLLTDSIIDRKLIDKTNFEKFLIPEFYSECNLYSTEIDSVLNDKVFLTSDLAIPDTSDRWKVWYSIIIENNQLGELKVSKTEYRGM